ncbi:MAG TPA: NACHT domain-containing protein [Oscillatoriaceae cyanobacterium M33_DOE_052]|uniref:NACHT domain-containing protein n=1 Tax=Planktothricoides sp. SpSt-374 TaxID=2282167 RepID=A0A7C3VMQ2_9CYAN|nr:NACHT domain-containing protein [Oscillatoriaceae cyanobacterium M33_DOE_052]
MTSQPNEPEDFAEAAERWDLDRLYADLAAAKEDVGSHPRQGLTSTEKTHLRGLLCGYSPVEMARILHKTPKGLYADLAKTLYRYIEILTGNPFSSWNKIVPGLAEAGYRKLSPRRSQDWNLAPDVSIFYGRTHELALLQQWIVGDRCRLVALLGMGGMGKTALAVRLAQQIAGDFKYIGWRSLSNSPTVPQLLTELLGFYPHTQGNPLDFYPLLNYLQNQRSLIILDGLENLLAPGELAGKYRDGHEEYANLFKQVGTTQHQSCIVITSSEKSREISLLDSLIEPVRCLNLAGLEPDAAVKIIKDRQLLDEHKWDDLIERSSGNPLALKIVCGIIKGVFKGRVGEYFRHKTMFMGMLREVLSSQINRLSDLELQIMYQIAISGEPVDIEQLRQWISASVPMSGIMEILNSLIWRSLIETIGQDDVTLYTIQPMVRKYLINLFSQPDIGKLP